jgi:fibronectin-binding autotransporter adhesin
VYVHLSEPVVNFGGTPITMSNFTFAGINPAAVAAVSSREYLLNFDPGLVTFTVDNIASADLVTYIDIEDSAATPNPLEGVPLPGNVTHRVSDLALGIVGEEPIVPFLLFDQSPREPGPEGVGYITVFDGSGWIQDTPDQPLVNPVLQANFGAAMYGVSLVWDTNVGSAYIANGLWLPQGSNTYGLVPIENPPGAPGTEAIGGVNNAGPPAHSDFTFDLTHGELVSEVVVEFFIQFTASGVYAARLAHPTASDWYRSVKPWAFGIHRAGDNQKGNVTIYNNVINPNAGEQVKIHYILKRSGSVTIQVFTLAGDIVDVLYRGSLGAGEHSTSWDGRNRGGRVVAKGLYFIRIVGPDVDETRKVLVVK